MTLASARKAIAPAVLATGAVIGQWIASGDLDVTELRTALAGGFVALVVWAVPNSPAL